jgi:hypothetical protein
MARKNSCPGYADGAVLFSCRIVQRGQLHEMSHALIFQ